MVRLVVLAFVLGLGMGALGVTVAVRFYVTKLTYNDHSVSNFNFPASENRPQGSEATYSVEEIYATLVSGGAQS